MADASAACVLCCRVACFFHLFFKGAALAMYLIGLLLLKNFVAGFIVCILLLAFDFWTVKNVSGRLLVGLRWWNEVKEDGTNVWVFESKPVSCTASPAPLAGCLGLQW